jgi:hypothetical protein
MAEQVDDLLDHSVDGFVVGIVLRCERPDSGDRWDRVVSRGFYVVDQFDKGLGVGTVPVDGGDHGFVPSSSVIGSLSQ